jgi:Ser/Thr protein kinase RdoA (MazF antagonist)
MLTKQKMPVSTVRKILDNFSLNEIESIKSLATSGNIAYTIKTKNKSYFLRLCPGGQRWRSKEEIAAELELIHHLLKHNFPAVRSITAKNGKSIIKWENHFGYLSEFIDAKSKLSPALKEVEEFGELLGRFHKLTENYKTKNKRIHIFDLEKTREYFRQARKTILKSGFKDKKIFVENLERGFSSLDFSEKLPSGTIHEDLGKRHILWKNGKIAAMIDFDRSYYGKLVFDLGQACRGWCFTDNWKKWSNGNFRALLKGYEKRRKLSALEKKYLPDAIKFGVLERALAFGVRFIRVTKDREDEKYAIHSASEKGLMGMLDKNKKEIEKIIAV